MKLLSCETCKFHDAGRCRRYAPGRGGQEVKSAPTVTPTRDVTQSDLNDVYEHVRASYLAQQMSAAQASAAYQSVMQQVLNPGNSLGAPYTPDPWPRVQADDWCGDWDA